jgi:hypothetical protein
MKENNKLLLNDKQTKLGDFIQPKQKDIFRTSGKCYYTEATRACTKIIFKNEFAEECEELKKRDGNFMYNIEFPKTEETKKQYIRILLDNLKNKLAWPFLLWIREMPKQEVNQNV